MTFTRVNSRISAFLFLVINLGSISSSSKLHHPPPSLLNHSHRNIESKPPHLYTPREKKSNKTDPGTTTAPLSPPSSAASLASQTPTLFFYQITENSLANQSKPTDICAQNLLYLPLFPNFLNAPVLKHLTSLLPSQPPAAFLPPLSVSLSFPKSSFQKLKKTVENPPISATSMHPSVISLSFPFLT